MKAGPRSRTRPDSPSSRASMRAATCIDLLSVGYRPSLDPSPPSSAPYIPSLENKLLPRWAGHKLPLCPPLSLVAHLWAEIEGFPSHNDEVAARAASAQCRHLVMAVNESRGDLAGEREAAEGGGGGGRRGEGEGAIVEKGGGGGGNGRVVGSCLLCRWSWLNALNSARVC